MVLILLSMALMRSGSVEDIWHPFRYTGEQIVTAQGGGLKELSGFMLGRLGRSARVFINLLYRSCRFRHRPPRRLGAGALVAG
jgi:hypothetical protein